MIKMNFTIGTQDKQSIINTIDDVCKYTIKKVTYLKHKQMIDTMLQ